MILISPSLLAADFARLGEEVKKAETNGADMLHIDVMDGHFVPNISFGIPIIKSLRPISKLFFDVHLMISHPLQYAAMFAKAGADGITFHIESEDDCQATIDAIKACGCKVGLSLKPKTPASAVIPYLPFLDMVLMMTVEPGFGGQSFMNDQLAKIAEIKQVAITSKPALLIQVDGGIDAVTAPLVIKAGANCLVSGSYLFGAPDMVAAMDSLRR